jgi:hypothetical protein
MDTTKNQNTEVPAIFTNWASQEKELKKKHTELTAEDLKFEIGKENELIKRIQSRLHKNREDVITLIKTSQTEAV